MDTKAEPAPRAGRRRAGPAGFEMSDGDDDPAGRNHRRLDLDEAIVQYSDNWWRTTRGRMKWFDLKKGFGFVATEAGKDGFVHKSAIVYDAANACPGRKCSLYLDGELEKLRASHLVWLGDDDPVSVPDAAW
eukprot:gene8895-14184_t